jgi:hypothetical protein
MGRVMRSDESLLVLLVSSVLGLEESSFYQYTATFLEASGTVQRKINVDVHNGKNFPSREEEEREGALIEAIRFERSGWL